MVGVGKREPLEEQEDIEVARQNIRSAAAGMRIVEIIPVVHWCESPLQLEFRFLTRQP